MAKTMKHNAKKRSLNCQNIADGRRFFLLLFLILICCLLSFSAFASDQKIRVGYYPVDNFQEYSESTGSYRGYSYDYMLAIAQYAGWSYEFVPVSADAGLDMLKRGQLDLMNGIEKTDTNGKDFLFSALPSGSSCTCLDVLPENSDVSYEDFSEIGKLTVGLYFRDSHVSSFVDYCKDNDCMPELVYFHSEDEVSEALRSGRINACIVSSLKNVNMRTVAKFATKDYYFAVTKDKPDLMKELNASMNELAVSDPNFDEKVYSQYHSKSERQQTVISEEEKKYVAEHPVQKVAFIPDWYPFSYSDRNGSFDGAMDRILSKISERTGLQFSYTIGNGYQDTTEKITSGECDIMAGFPYDFKWALNHKMKLTTPFISLNVFGVYRNKAEKGNTVAVPEQYYREYLIGTILKDPYRFRYYKNMEDCLDAVLSGDCDYTFLDSYQLEYYNKRAKYANLSYKVLSGAEYRVSFGVAENADPRLISILDKALASIGTDEIGEILTEASLKSDSRTLMDFVFVNPRMAGLLFSLFGFLLALVIGTVVYTKSMHKKNLQLKEAANAKAAFLSTISHDMRTPLNGIIGYTGLALDTKDPEQMRDYLGKIKISGNFLLDLINDTLDISKIENGKYQLNLEPVSMHQLLSSIIVPIREVAAQKGVHFTAETECAYTGYILADPLNVQKIILNLLSNAIKFTKAGGEVVLRVEDIDPPEKGCNYRITVQDTGVGIGRDFLDKLFEPFSQERSPETSRQIGTGLGLSIVKKITEQMGGSIRVQSEKGKGSSFIVTLPAEHIADPNVQKKEAEDYAFMLSGKRILLCEDNEMNTEIAVHLLEAEGIKVTTAKNGSEGVKLFAASPSYGFDLILMDLRMPVLDGFEAAEKIRAMDRPDAATVPIIAMTADAYEDNTIRCRKAGINGHIAKPVDPQNMFREIRKFCGNGEANG